MKRKAALLFGLLAALLALSVAQTSHAADAEEVARGARALTEARAGTDYAFCTKPKKPMQPRHAALCPLAFEIEGCEGFAKACEERAAPPETPRWLLWLVQALAPLAPYLLWGTIAAIVLAILVPIVMALLRARREQRSAREPRSSNVAEVLAAPPPDPEELGDAEIALRMADETARAGDGARAVALYLVASLIALDRRGAVRLARHRTNGEYVRSCTDPEAKPPLREVVREVDRATFGHETPSADTVARVAARATALVRKAAAIATTTLLALVLSGCTPPKGTGPDDPAGDQLPVDVLGRAGHTVDRLGRSLASLPIPENETITNEVVVVDVEKVQLEDETRAHLLRWVEAGGTLVLFGSPTEWPEELGAKVDVAADRAVSVKSSTGPGKVEGARLAAPRGLTWKDAAIVARIGEDTPYAAVVDRWRGHVVGVASDDLFTNVGVSRPANAAALLALVGHAVRAAARLDGDAPPAQVREARAAVKIHVARPEDGIPPPSNPFASLVRAGLGTAVLHGLLAALVLFLAVGIRHARARPEPAPVRRAFTEHIEATGAFYERARTLPHALAAYATYVEAHLRERAPRGTSPAAFLAHRAGVPLEEASAALERGLAAAKDEAPRGDELGVIRALRDLYVKTL